MKAPHSREAESVFVDAFGGSTSLFCHDLIANSFSYIYIFFSFDDRKTSFHSLTTDNILIWPIVQCEKCETIVEQFKNIKVSNTKSQLNYFVCLSMQVRHRESERIIFSLRVEISFQSSSNIVLIFEMEWKSIEIFLLKKKEGCNWSIEQLIIELLHLACTSNSKNIIIQVTPPWKSVKGPHMSVRTWASFVFLIFLFLRKLCIYKLNWEVFLSPRLF